MDVVTLGAAKSAAKKTHGDYGYLIATFVGDAAALNNLNLFFSPDGKTVVAGGVKNPVYKPAGATYGHRDPSLIRKDGVWYVAQTKNDGITFEFEVAKSVDLINWTKIATVDCTSIAGSTKIWAPELIVDEAGDVYAFYSSSATTMYWSKATNATLTAWTAPVAMSWAAAPTQAIDATFVKQGNLWYCFYKNEVTKYIERATSSTLTGTYTIDKTGNWAGWGSGIEGPELVKLPSGKWRIYMDQYANQFGYGYSESTDLTTWTALTTLTMGPNFPAGQKVRHGTFYRIQNAQEAAMVYAGVIAPNPKQNISGKSANYSLTVLDDVIVVTGGTGLTMTLPDPTTVSRKNYVIKNTTANAVTVASAGTSKTIDGAASVSLGQMAAGRYLSDGAVWLAV